MFQKKFFCFFILVGMMLGGLAPPIPAFAQKVQGQMARAEVINARARAAYAQKKFGESAELFLAAYELSGSPGTLFNAARAMQQAGKLREAREMFHLFRTKTRDQKGIAEADLQLKLIDAELLRIEQQEKLLAEQQERLLAEQKRKQQQKSVVVVDLPKPATPSAIAKAKEIPKLVIPPQVAEKKFSLAKLAGWKSYTALGLATTGIGLILGGRSVAQSANERPIESLADKEAYKSSFNAGNALWWTGVGLTVASASFASWATIDAAK
jgi:tetratricopeptide (TPR) repeat protein